MSFFGNDAINRVNLHTGVQALAQGAGGVFVLVFLLRAGVSAPLVLCSMAALNAGRFLLRPLVLPFARRFGLRTTLILGTVLEAAIFPILPLVHGVDMAFFAMLLVGPVGSVLYWTAYHAYFASLGDDEHRGGQVGAREALRAVVGVAAPLLGGWTLVLGGPWLAFLIAAAIQATAALPLLGAPRIAVAEEAPGSFRASWMGMGLMTCDGIFAGGYHYVWQIALFISLGESFTAYGGAMALAALVGAAFSLLVGRHIDAGGGRAAAVVAFVVMIAVLAFRAFSLGDPWLAVTANALGALVEALWIPALMAPVYTLSKASPCPLRFSVATEAGWDLGCAGACLVGAAVIAIDHTFAAPILVGLVGAVAAFALLWRNYAAGSGPAARST
ncbi:MAG: MFS transporter [Alphaproteobacteria bacterium]|nr:MFS transporter [Alphaproteobacteria bacterium]MBU1515538.1 MFS transporter [Alphaproteobacteria bacterium]MBU2095536.1 MFS transporter [Alphaproteobacteria bacterium]MBU2150777.1 MFS transporter [Alphaproteobacteria bacterium]MBU2307042.1 MFS transporter [Alphaproteobacteria bacterium]